MSHQTPVLLLTLVSCVAAVGAHAGGYIKFDGVEGESKHKDHKNWIDVASFNAPGVSYDGRTNRVLAETRSGDSTGPGTLTFTKTWDRSSGELAEAARTKRPIRSVEIQLCETEHSCVTYRMKQAVIEKYTISGEQEEVTVSYPKIDWNVPLQAKPDRSR